MTKGFGKRTVGWSIRFRGIQFRGLHAGGIQFRWLHGQGHTGQESGAYMVRAYAVGGNRGYIILLLQVFFYGTKMERKLKNTSSCGRIKAGIYIWEVAG